MEWQILVNHNRAENIYADTFMEAELIARIQFGLTARLDISPIPEDIDPPAEEWEERY